MGIITIKTVYFFNSTNQRNRLSSFFSICFGRKKRLKGSEVQHALCFNPVKLSPQRPCDHLKHLQREQPLIVSKTRCWLYNRKSFLKIFIFVYHQKIKLLYKTETTKETINNSLKPQILTHKTRRHFIEVACVKVKNLFFQVLKSGWPSGKHSALYLD